MRAACLAILLATISGGCGQATAAAVDPKNDVHCSVLAFYFHGLATHTQASEKQVRATKGLHDWYAAKMKEVADERFKNPAFLQNEVGPVLEAVKADPLAMRDEMSACAERAAADPSFNRFASGYMR